MEQTILVEEVDRVDPERRHDRVKDIDGNAAAAAQPGEYDDRLVRSLGALENGIASAAKEPRNQVGEARSSLFQNLQ